MKLMNTAKYWVKFFTIFSVFVELRLKLSMVCESPLHGPRNYIDRAWERPASYNVRTFFLSRETKTPLA